MRLLAVSQNKFSVYLNDSTGINETLKLTGEE